MFLAHLLVVPASHLSCQPISSSFLRIFSGVASRTPSSSYPRLTFLFFRPPPSLSPCLHPHLICFALDLRLALDAPPCPVAQFPSFPSPALLCPSSFSPLTLCCWLWPLARGTCLTFSIVLPSLIHLSRLEASVFCGLLCTTLCLTYLSPLPSGLNSEMF